MQKPSTSKSIRATNQRLFWWELRKPQAIQKREELQETLQELSPGEHVIVTYYNNGQYNRLRGRMIYLNPLKRTLNVSKIEIPLKDIYNIDVLY